MQNIRGQGCKVHSPMFISIYCVKPLFDVHTVWGENVLVLQASNRMNGNMSKAEVAPLMWPNVLFLHQNTCLILPGSFHAVFSNFHISKREDIAWFALTSLLQIWWVINNVTILAWFFCPYKMMFRKMVYV